MHAQKGDYMKKQFPDIKVMDYKSALDYVYSNSGNPQCPKYAIISIQEPTNGYGFGLAFKCGGNCLAALNIEFSDCTPAIQLPGMTLMSRKNALEIHDFVESLPDEVESLIIHCNKGKSRSVAVAAAILLVKTGSYKQIVNDVTALLNKYVYYMILETYGIHNYYWELYYKNDMHLLAATTSDDSIDFVQKLDDFLASHAQEKPST